MSKTRSQECNKFQRYNTRFQRFRKFMSRQRILEQCGGWTGDAIKRREVKEEEEEGMQDAYTILTKAAYLMYEGDTSNVQR